VTIDISLLRVGWTIVRASSHGRWISEGLALSVHRLASKVVPPSVANRLIVQTSPSQSHACDSPARFEVQQSASTTEVETTPFTNKDSQRLQRLEQTLNQLLRLLDAKEKSAVTMASLG